MEFVATKQCRKRRKKRHLRKRLRERIRFEVRSTKNWRVFPEYLNPFNARKILRTSTMQADAFWKNYAVAQEWQKRHNVTWWRSRCVALEHENEVLRNKLRSLAQHSGHPIITQENNYHEEYDDEDAEEEIYTKPNTDIENFELNVTEDMLNFFETSERHRRELQQKRASEIVCNEEILEEVSIINNAENACVKEEQTDLLYGDASSEILAMEISLDAAMNRHEDITNPQYWSSSPLEP